MDRPNSDEPWEQAKQIASLLGDVPSPFATAIRFLRIDAERWDNEIGKLSQFCMRRLVNSMTCRSALYYCARTFRPEKLASLEQLGPEALLKIFNAGELSTILAMIYLYHRVKRGCNKKNWELIAQPLMVHCELGGHIGEAIPNIGLSIGLLSGAMRFFGSSMFLGIDEKQYLKYRRDNKIKRIAYDLDQEFTLWGCNHIQVGSLMLQALGLGVPFAQAIAVGLEQGYPDPASQLNHLPMAVGVTSTWIDSFLKTGKVPDIIHRGEFYPRENDLAKLEAAVKAILANGSQHQWLMRGKSDISAESVPFLFIDKTSTAEEATNVLEELQQ